MFHLWPHWIQIIEIRGANNDWHLVIIGSCQDIYHWWSCKVSFTPNTAEPFHWRCFQTNKPLPKSEHLVLVAVYLKILNACKIIVVKIAIWQFVILIRFLRSKSISNSFSMKTNSFLRANNPYLELCKGLQKILGLTNNHYRKYWSQSI